MADFLSNNCTFLPLTSDLLQKYGPFNCGVDVDMDEFFEKDSETYREYRMGNSYCFLLDESPNTIVACFTVSNDSLRIYDLPSSRRNAMWGLTNREKMLKRFPGVLIGRLAVAQQFARKGIGTELLEFIKFWLEDKKEKSACRFLIVDAKNEPNVLSFYTKNNFKFLFTTELQEDLYTNPPKDKIEADIRKSAPNILKTRLMFYDLLENATFGSGLCL